MSKNFRKKYINARNKNAFTQKLFGKIESFFVWLYKILFSKRTILIVSNKKIRSINLGFAPQFIAIITLIFLANMAIKSIYFNQLIGQKSEEISDLRDVNKYFEEEIRVLNEKLEKISEYINTVNGPVKNVSGQEFEFRKPTRINEDTLSGREKGTFEQIKEASKKVFEIKIAADLRIQKLEDVIEITGLNLKKMPAQSLKNRFLKSSQDEESHYSKNYPKGGVAKNMFFEEESLENSEIDSLVEQLAVKENVERDLDRKNFSNEIDYLISLEKITKALPLGKPMRNYFISSSFGARSDPFHRGSAMHKGLDFVGVSNEKVISPSSGRVILAGTFSNYGNAVVIDHGFGITTRYGHLSAVKVQVGQVLKRGDIVGLQGSTGRSTGAHLHYEVRYKNTPINPKRFLEAGNIYFSKESHNKFVSS